MMQDLSQEIVGLYERHALAWDRDRQSHVRDGIWIDKDWHDRFVSKLERGASVLDLGCGPGRPVAHFLAEEGLRVTGIDASPTMFALCRERLPDQEWIVAD